MHSPKKHVYGLVLSALLCALALVPHGAQASTLTVTSLLDNADNAACSTTCTLRQAINASVDGDTIQFAPGLRGTITLNTDYGVLDAQHSVAIVGPGRDRLTVSGSDTIAILTVGPKEVSLSGLTFANGFSNDDIGGAIWSMGTLTISHMAFVGNVASHGGGAIYDESGALTISDTIFRNNSTQAGGDGNGGALYIHNGWLVLQTSDFISNASYGGGGAIYLSGGSDESSITSSTFENNTSDVNDGYGGAAIFDQANGNPLRITNSTFKGNRLKSTNTGMDGGAINTSAPLEVTGSSFVNNYAPGYGGAVIALSGVTTFTNTNFTGNTAGMGGGALMTDQATTTGGSFTNNVAGLSGSGGGGAIFPFGNITIDGTEFINNTSRSSAGGAILAEAGLTIRNAVFRGNTSERDGGAIYYDDGSNHTIDNTEFTSNTALYSGGAIAHYTGTLAVTNSSFTGNVCDTEIDGDAGGAMVSTGTSLTVSNTTFTGNVAAGGASGGALYAISSVLSLAYDTFANNTAANGGGALYVASPVATIATSTFTHNTTFNTNGGAIFDTTPGTLSIWGSVFSENSATYGTNGGGAIYNSFNNGFMSIEGSLFKNNSANGNGGGGAVFFYDLGSIDNSTFIGNHAWGSDTYGGAVIAQGSVAITNSTFAENTAMHGAGVYSVPGSIIANSTFSNNVAQSGEGVLQNNNFGGSLTVTNSIVSGRGGNNCAGNAIYSGGHNIFSDESCSTTDGDQVTDPLLDPEGPRLNGHAFLPTVGLLSGSPAIGSGDSCTTYDERGVFRDGCDKGAYQYDGVKAATTPHSVSADIVVTRPDDPVGGYCDPGVDCSLRQAIASSTADQVIGFAPTVGNTLVVTGSPLYIGHTLTISGPGETLLTLSGASASRILDIEGAGMVTVDHVTIADAYGSGDGGAVWSDSPLTFSHVVFRNNKTPNEGGAIYEDCASTNADVTLDHTSFYGNEAGETGGAVYMCGSTSMNTLTLASSTFVANSASGSGGALYLHNTNLNGDANTLFSANNSNSEGGAIYMTSSDAQPTLQLTGTTFVSNTAIFGGAVSNGFSAPIHVHVSGLTATGNSTFYNGSAFYMSGQYTDELSASTFSYDHSKYGWGGALYMVGEQTATTTLSNDTFLNNVAGAGEGGAAYFNGGTGLHIDGSHFTGNAALDNPGGALAVLGYSSVVVDGNSDFSRNIAWYGQGGALLTTSGDLSVSNSIFSHNKALSYGGAVASLTAGNTSLVGGVFVGNLALGSGGALLNDESTGLLTVDSSSFENNMTVGGSGGALNNWGAGVTIHNSSFKENETTSMGGDNGGALYSGYGSVVIDKSTFADNSASSAGGAIKQYANTSPMDIRNSTFFRNYAANGGAGLYVDTEGTLTLNNDTFAYNFSPWGGSGLAMLSGNSVINNSIFYGAKNGSCYDDGGIVSRASSLRNIEEAHDGNCFGETDNRIGVNPFLNTTLSDHLGAPQTIDIATSTSPALSYGVDCESVDEIGQSRPIGGGCDIGASESLFVVDTAGPIIRLNGAQHVVTHKNQVFVDQGATATDETDGSVTVTVGGDTVDTATVGTYHITYDAQDGSNNQATQVIRTVDVQEADVATSTIATNEDADVYVPATVANPQLDMSHYQSGLSATVSNAVTVYATTTSGVVMGISFASSTTFTSAGASWDGVIRLPTPVENPTVTPSSGHTATVDSAIEIGLGSTALTFDKGVRLLFSGKAGKLVGWTRDGSFAPITSACSADTQTAGNALSAGADCKIDVGSDLVVWTKHFTTYVVYTETPTQSSGGGGGGGGGTLSGPLSVSYVGSTPVPTPAPVAQTQKTTSTVTTKKVPTTTAATSTKTYKFTRNLAFGMKGSDVIELQRFLNSHGFLIAKKGPGSPGKELNTFGAATRTALAKFQNAHKAEILTPQKLTRGNGNFYGTTRAFVNQMLERGE